MRRTASSTSRRTEPVLDQVTGFQLAKASIVADAVFERCVGTPLTLRPVEYALLQMVREHPGGSSVRLATALGVSRPHVSVWIEKLEARGLLVRATNESDRRSQKLSVTASGEALARDATQRLVGGERQAFGVLSPAEHAMLNALLRKLGSVIGQTGSDDA